MTYEHFRKRKKALLLKPIAVATPPGPGNPADGEGRPQTQPAGSGGKDSSSGAAGSGAGLTKPTKLTLGEETLDTILSGVGEKDWKTRASTAVEALNQTIKELREQTARLQADGEEGSNSQPIPATTPQAGVPPALGLGAGQANDLQNSLLASKNALEKLALGVHLSQDEKTMVEKLNPADLVRLTLAPETKGQIGLFNYPTGSVIRVTFYLNDKNVLITTGQKLLANHNYQNISPLNVENLNYDTNKIDLLYIVVKNNNTVSWETLVVELQKQIFEDGMSYLYSADIILEAVGYAQVYPFKENYQQKTLSFGSPGKLDAAIHKPSVRPFVINMVSDFVYSSRNAYTIRLHKASTKLAHFQSDGNGIDKLAVTRFLTLLQDMVIVGPANDVMLKLCFKNMKGNNPLMYAPVKMCTALGYTGIQRFKQEALSINKKDSTSTRDSFGLSSPLPPDEEPSKPRQGFESSQRGAEDSSAIEFRRAQEWVQGLETPDQSPANSSPRTPPATQQGSTRATGRDRRTRREGRGYTQSPWPFPSGEGSGRSGGGPGRGN